MRFVPRQSALRHRTRRLAAQIVAMVAASAGVVTAGAAPAHADTWSGWWYLKSGYVGSCMATDYSTNVYVFTGCNGPQRWQFQYLDAYPGYAVIKNEATKYCLMQFDYFRVVSSPACDGANAGFRWRWYNSNNLQSANTGGFLRIVPGSSVVGLNGYPDTRSLWFMHG
ncbi:hypothetical protein [Actinoplanes aureus]|uniref:Uncharacterized protein n=1 Tax=Actinoplanes aureus TaxID=2792083 RepID=A0A931FYP1_9ACTN|nr:hypothetical protein [Actinoplanes aureus]MBG0564793.1 hypothetical protein [Actinoplanes aureus]